LPAKARDLGTVAPIECHASPFSGFTVMQHSLPEWITAAATAATAIAAVIAGAIAWLSFRREGKPRLPVIEPEFSWAENVPNRLNLRLIVRNQIYETLIVDCVSICHPRGATIMIEKNNGRGGTDILPTTETHMVLDWSVDPIGSVGTSFFYARETVATDVGSRWLFFAMPPNWEGGEVKLEFRLSSAALTIRDKRIVVKRHVPAAPNTQSDPKASNEA
jgi:hypothetical protein